MAIAAFANLGPAAKGEDRQGLEILKPQATILSTLGIFCYVRHWPFSPSEQVAVERDYRSRLRIWLILLNSNYKIKGEGNNLGELGQVALRSVSSLDCLGQLLTRLTLYRVMV